MLLVEHHRVLTLLLEAREDGLLKRFVPVIEKNWSELERKIGGALSDVSQFISEDHKAIMQEIKSDPLAARRWQEKGFTIRNAMAPAIIRFIISKDPDQKKSFSTWMTTMFSRGDFNLEDMPRVVDGLTTYIEAKKNRMIPRDHDLGRVKTLPDFYALVAPFRQEREGQNLGVAYEHAMLAQSTVVFDGTLGNHQYLILIPDTEAASQYWGRNTEWCTAWGSDIGRHPTKTCQFVYYQRRGPLYIVNDLSTGDQWQFHFQTHQFMDVNDRQIDVDAFYRSKPEVAAFFEDRDRQNHKVIATINDMAVTDDGHMVQVRTGFGLKAQNPAFSVQYATAKSPRMIQDVTWQHHFNGSPDDIIAVLNTARLRGNHSVLLKNGIACGPEGTWGRPYDVCPTLLDVPEQRMVWKKVEGDGYWLYLSEPHNTNQENIEYLKFIPTGNHEFIVKYVYEDFDHDEIIERVGESFTALIRHLNDPLITMDQEESSPILTDYFDEESQKALLKDFPGVGNVVQHYEVTGNTELLRARLAELVQASDTRIEWDYIDDNTKIIFNYPNLEEMVDDLGTDEARAIADYLVGKRHFEHHSYDDVDPSTIEVMLRGLPVEGLRAIASYIIEHAGDTGNLDEDEMPDPSLAEKITKSWEVMGLYNEYGCYDLKQCAKFAYDDGCERGAEGEMHDAFMEAVRAAPVMYKTKKGWTHAVTWDTECALVADVPKLIAVCRDYDCDLNHVDWIDELGAKIDVDEPHYGWDGYDAEYALESFIERIFEQDIVDQETMNAIRAHRQAIMDAKAAKSKTVQSS